MVDFNAVASAIRHTKVLSEPESDIGLTTVTFKVLTKDNLDELLKVAIKLWPNHTEDDLRDEYTKALDSMWTCCVGVYEDSDIIGFAHCHIYDEGVSGSHHEKAGYLEGIFIEEDYRELGIASYLIKCCEKWSKALGCKYFGSDCYLGNVASYNLHIKSGFTVSKCDIHFIKKIEGSD